MARGPFVAYVDESGDSGMANPDPSFPVFVLTVALFRIDDYLATDLPIFSDIKFRHWWHDAVVFHSHKIRKKVYPFQSLVKAANQRAIFQSITDYFARSTVTIIAAAINKTEHAATYKFPANPYHLALQFCLERTFGHLKSRGSATAETMFVFEKRGKREDTILRAEFDRIVAGANLWSQKLPFRLTFAGKEENITGLQIADLAAYPIARYVETGNAARPDWKAIQPRIRQSPTGKMDGWGLKVFP